MSNVKHGTTSDTIIDALTLRVYMRLRLAHRDIKVTVRFDRVYPDIST
jgi:hypothetical protein